MSKFGSLQKIRSLHRGNFGTIHGTFFPLHKEKYIGTYPITYRSSYELKLMQWADLNDNVIQWGSENIVVLYLDPTNIDPNTGKATQHKYFVDFSVAIRQKDGTVKKFLVEVKPSGQCKMPKKTKRMDEKAYNERLRTFLKNSAKWAAANEVAKQRGMQFIIVTEKELGIK